MYMDVILQLLRTAAAAATAESLNGKVNPTLQIAI
jgi:hypothetical protein